MNARKLKELEEQNAHLREQNIYCNHQVVMVVISVITIVVIFTLLIKIKHIYSHHHVITLILRASQLRDYIEHHYHHHHHRRDHCPHQMELLRVRLAQLQELGQTTASRRESVAEVIVLIIIKDFIQAW